MILSARNQLKGKIESVEEGAVNAIVVLKTDSGHKITSTISIASVKELGLIPGKEVLAVIKSTEVMIGLGNMKLSARNQIPGEIVKIDKGAVNAIVTLKIQDGVMISSTISMASLRELELSAGSMVKAVIKATSVMIGVQE